MKDQNDPVTPDEYLYRRILNKEDFYNPALDEPVARQAFRPTNQDTKGISFYRCLFTTAEQIALAGPNPAGYLVAKFQVREIIKLNNNLEDRDIITFVPSVDDIPGHCHMPNIRLETNNTTKRLQRQLAKMACIRIVYPPDRMNLTV